MPNVTQTLRFRRHQPASEFHSPWVKLGLTSALLISLLMVTITLAGVWFYIHLTRDLPSVEVLPPLLESPNGTLLQPTRLYDRTHEHVILTLENPAAEGKQYLSVGMNGPEGANQVSNYLVDATIAEFDPNFWNEQGYTLSGIFEGTHSTLAQQLITNLVLEDEPPSLERNIRERLLAAQATVKFGREKILEWYLNSARYGDFIYGADAAAHVFFSKSATELSLSEAAILTALAETPGSSESVSIPILKKQQELIIDKMLLDGYVSVDEARNALKQDIHLQDQIEQKPLAAQFTGLVLMQLSSALPLERVYRGGLDIITSLDYEIQLQAACTTQIQIARIQETAKPAVTYDGTPCAADQLLPTLQTADEKSPQEISAEVVIIDPHSGQILAMVGESGSGMIPAYPTTHPAGYILSPFLYLTAFSHGMSPANLLWDIPNSNKFDASDLSGSNLTNSLTTSYHGPVSLRKAFVNDYQGAAAEVLQQVSLENVWLTENLFGINAPEITPNIETGLDDFYSQKITLLDSVQAYAVLADQGLMTGLPVNEKTTEHTQNGLSYSSILRVVGVDGQVWLDWTKPQDLPVVSPQISYLTTSVLSDEKARWPTLGHPNSSEIGRPAAVKVSLTADANNGWTVGYIPQLAVGVWIGHNQGDGSGIAFDMPIGLWHALLQYISNGIAVEDFTPPPGISLVQVCDPSGLLVSPLCQTIVQEVFLSGNEPTQTDNLYQKVYIDRQTELLATIFTPSAVVDEKVFLTIPTNAVAWAKEAGFAIPPDTYDSIPATQPSSQQVQISYPHMFAHMGGQINFLGDAGGDNFSYYRIQVGQGLYPRQWIQIGEDVHQPVVGGLLGTWNTHGLEGEYIVELLVVKRDLKIDRAIIQVMIDNTSPEVQILSPKNDEQFAFEQDGEILLNAIVNDNLDVQRVEFIVDGKLSSTLYAPPYIILWDAFVGEHILQVKAYDAAGNQNESTVAFFVIRK